MLDGEVLAERAVDRRFASASMIKTFLLELALDSGAALDARVPVADDLRCGGDGVLERLAVPDGLPLRDHLRLMMVISDNTATNVVADALGGLEAINARLAERGGVTRMRRYVDAARPEPWSGAEAVRADPALPTPAGLGVTTVAEHAAAVDRLLDRPLARELLLGQQDRRSLRRRLREHVRFAHKTGTVGRARHDGGVVLLADGRRLSVTAFTDGGPEAEWPDHPACLGMAAGMAATLDELGLDLVLR